MIDAAGRRDTFRGLPRTPPLNALAFALRSPTFRLRDLVRLDAKAAAPLATVSVPQTYYDLDDRDAATFLRDINFPDAARHLAFEVFARSFFARPEYLSAGELATMFHIYFLGSSEGLIFDVANANFDVALWNPLRKYLEGNGVRFHTGLTVDGLSLASDVRVQCGADAGFAADAVVLATDVAGLRRIVAGSPGLGDDEWRHRVAELHTAPPFVVLRSVAGPPGACRPSGLRRDRWPSTAGQCQRAGALRTRSGAMGRAHRRFGRGVARLLGDRLRRRRARAPWWHACTSCTRKPSARRSSTNACCAVRTARVSRPGDFADRPTVQTPDSRVVLAGDGIRIDLPVALMERAATTGWTAANHLLGGFGLAGHPLHTVPNRGRSALLRRLAARAGGEQR